MPELHTFGNLLVCVNLLFQIVKSLLDVFVGIEITGESVAFAEKFKYRQPMYIVMKYLWKIEEQRGCFE
jgi:ubiquitin conjugation factor E4 A